MFKKLRVVELASVLAGPSVGQFFAELGAEVIKVENPATEGDVTRSWYFSGESHKSGISSYFSSVNWGKKSILLDLKSEAGRGLLYKLIPHTDIVIASYKPGDAEKLQVDYETLKGINPKLIYGHVTGYGGTDQRVGYDAVIQAESGFMSINGAHGGGPTKMPVALMDVLAGHHLKQGLLVALIQRMSSGNGAYVPVALIDAAVSSLVNQAANWLVGQKVPVRMGNEHPNIAPYGDVFRSKDGKEMILAVGNDKQFQSLNEILGITLYTEAKFATNLDRVKNRKALNDVLRDKIKSYSSDILISQLQKLKVPVGVVKTIDEVFADGETHWLHSVEHLRGVKAFMASPEGFESPRKLSKPPKLGEHTEQVFENL